jgi:signal recognition particle receptor subunit beta
MVFFNYSTMQMAAKIVYYGPGLCGKTTNLQHIYGRTSSESRGEMVSLETETDRTLFFDLLPIDVGSIAGFNTRIQLYTVPGQVFYNTTRKLVLKGVDGVVFVADSQRAMLGANKDSFQNLEENLREMGLSVDEIPLVLQYNKRDLPDVLSVEELDQALNRQGWPSFEAAALHGQGVFETLKGISKATLFSLRQRLSAGSEGRPATATPQPAAAKPAAAEPAAAPAPKAPPAAAPAAKARPKKSVDVMGELERLRRQAQGPAARPRKAGLAGGNGRSELSRSVELALERQDLARVRRFKISVALEDEQARVVRALDDVSVDVDDPAALENLLLRLHIALSARE